VAVAQAVALAWFGQSTGIPERQTDRAPLLTCGRYSTRRCFSLPNPSCPRAVSATVPIMQLGNRRATRLRTALGMTLSVIPPGLEIVRAGATPFVKPNLVSRTTSARWVLTAARVSTTPPPHPPCPPSRPLPRQPRLSLPRQPRRPRPVERELVRRTAPRHWALWTIAPVMATTALGLTSGLEWASRC
jgi:hypothetical protein